MTTGAVVNVRASTAVRSPWPPVWPANTLWPWTAAQSMLIAGPAIPKTGRAVALWPSPYGSVPNDAVARLTDQGIDMLAAITVHGLRFGEYAFQVGIGGYNTGDPTQATIPDPALNALESPVWPTPAGTTYEPIDRIERPNDDAVCFLCRLERAEALAGLGELGLFARITDAGTSAYVLGDYYLFAVAHFPMRGKSAKEVAGYRVSLQTV